MIERPPAAPKAPGQVDPGVRMYATVATFVALVVYALSNNGGFQFFNYHVWLADAFLHGRLYLVNPPPWLNEITRIDGHDYVFFGPVPAILLMPLVAVRHDHLNLARVCVVMGAVNVGLVWRLLARLGCSRRVTAALTAVFAFGSVHYWASFYGNTWLWAQLCAVFFLLTATLELLGRRRAWLIGLLLGSAALSRESCALAFPFFALLINHPRLDKLRSAQLVGGIAVLAMFDCWYNWARFGNPLNDGYLHANQSFWHPEFGSFSWHYIWPELGTYFWRGPTFVSHFPFAVLTGHGLSIFWTTPAFLYLVPALGILTSRVVALVRSGKLAELRDDRDAAISLAAWAALLPMAGLYLVYFWDGWRQFGARYSLDYEVLILILLGLYLKERLTWKFTALAVVSVLINVWGMLYWRLSGW